MTDALNQSTAQKSLLQSSNNLDSLVNRVNQLQAEHKKFEHKNQITQVRVNQVIMLKKNSYDEKERLVQFQNDKMYKQQEKYARIQQMRSDIQEDRQAMFQQLNEQKSQDYIAAKQQSLVSEIKLREVRDQDQSRRREQAEKIIKWKADQKGSLQRYWENKVQTQKTDQENNKKKFIIQTSMQNKAFIELEKIELDLINKLKNTQQVNRELTSQLNLALNLPHQNLVEFHPVIDEHSGYSVYRSEQNWQKKIAQSPYLALPVIPRNNRHFKEPKSFHNGTQLTEEMNNNSQHSLITVRRLDQAASLPGLTKPKFKQQQDTVNRLYNSKKEFMEKIEIQREKEFVNQVKPQKDFAVKQQNAKKIKRKLQFEKKPIKNANPGSRKNTDNIDSEGKQQNSHHENKNEEENYEDEDQDFQEEQQDEADDKQEDVEQKSKLREQEYEKDFEEQQKSEQIKKIPDHDQQNNPQKDEEQYSEEEQYEDDLEEENNKAPNQGEINDDHVEIDGQDDKDHDLVDHNKKQSNVVHDDKKKEQEDFEVEDEEEPISEKE